MPDKLDSLPSSASKEVVSQSLTRQLTWRFLIVFAAVTMLGSFLLLISYRTVLQASDGAAANDTAAHITKNFQSNREALQRSAAELRAQIDFMRIFTPAPGADPGGSWLHLRAFFGAMDGKVGRFPSGVVLDSKGQPVFNFGSDGTALRRSLKRGALLPVWHYNPEQRTVYAIFSESLWLGGQGNGKLVLAQPVDNGLMRELAPLDSHLALVIDGRVVASSDGTQGMGEPLDADFVGRLNRDGRPVEQRVLLLFGDQAGAPRMVMAQKVREPLSTPLVLGASVSLMAALALILWLVLGRWSQSLTQRISALSRATALFAGEHKMGASLTLALDSANQRPDEIGKVALSCRHLMESVLEHDKEHFAYLQTLDILDEGVLELAPDGRYLLASPGWARLVRQSRRADSRIFEALHPEDEGNFRQPGRSSQGRNRKSPSRQRCKCNGGNCKSGKRKSTKCQDRGCES